MQILPKNIKQRYWNQAGSTILQVLILAGVFSVVATAVARLIFLNRNMVNEISSRMNVETLHAQIFAQLLDDQSCYNTFAAVLKAPNRTFLSVLDNNPVLASALPVYAVGQRYVTNVTIRSMTLTNYVSDATTDFAPFNSTAQINIVYTIPYAEGHAKDFERTFFIRTSNPAYPGAWASGVAMADAAVRCVASAPPGSTLMSGGLNLNINISKRYSDTKSSDLTVRRNAGGVVGRLLVNGNLVARGLFTLSDAELKQNIKPLNLNFSKFSKMNAYHFKWKDGEHGGFGFKAQEIKKIFPELVSQSQTTKYFQVDYFNDVPILLEGIRAVEKENLEIEKQISLLEKKEHDRETSKQ